ncbi:MAG: sugar transferase, partial [Saprospiraceae bacterium]|nr:sugar transferase [Saprospiraceae bacterium]
SAIVAHQHDCDLKEYLRRKFGIGYWKAFMLRWIPEKTFSDSHTSPSQRIQILLLVMLFAMIPFLLFWPIQSLTAMLILLIAFFVTGWPFIRFIAQRDAGLTLMAPGMLLSRAAGLGAGLIIGFIFPPKAISRKTSGLNLLARYAKRTVDIIGALVGLVIFSPVMLIMAILVKLDSPGPVIFWQERAGENGKPFKIAKMRTMYQGAEKEVSALLARNPLKGPVYKIPNDHRITRVGRFLRRSSLDEIPQFWNVWIGEMSLVGPRPEEMWVVAQYNDFQRQRLAVKPGMTGPMQVNGRGELDFDCRLDLELKYIKGYSLIKDFQILILTVRAVISGKGAS